MSRDFDRAISYDPTRLSRVTLAEATRQLALRWDPDGAIALALAHRPPDKDPTRPRTIAEAALQACGMLAAGGTAHTVAGYLRREETDVCGEPADDAEREQRFRRRWSAGVAMYRVVRGLPHEEGDDGADVTRRS